MTQTTTASLDIPQLMRSHKLRWLAPLIVVTVLGSLFAFVRRDMWEASQALMVRDEAASSGPERPGKFQHAEEMKTAQETILELAKSRSVLKAALEQAGPPAGRDAASYPTEADTARLQGLLKINAPKGAEFGKTEVFYLKVQDHDRDRALTLAGGICTQLQTRFQTLRDIKARSIIDELTRTAALAQADLAEATSQLSGMEQAVGQDLSELRILQESPSGESALRRMANEIENELRQVRYSQQLNDELYDLLVRSQSNTGELMAAPSRLLESQPALKKLKEALIDAQLRTAQLQGSMSEKHPSVAVAKAAEEEIAGHLHKELAVAIRGIELDRRVGAGRIDYLQAQLASAQQRMTRVASLRANYANAVSDVRHRTDIVKTAEQELAEARASQAAAHASSLISLVDAPEAGADPVGPSRAMIVLGSVVAGLLLGIGLLVWTAAPERTTALTVAASASAGITVDEVAPPVAEKLTLKQALERVSTTKSVYN